MSKQQLVNELHKPARRNYPRRRVLLKGLQDLWQADLVEMIPYSSINKGYKYLLTVIDCFSKYAYAEPVKSKTGKDVTEAFEKVIEKSAGKTPKHLQVDMGKEFYNSSFKTLMKQHDINLYSSYTVKKASIVERFNRTLKTWMWKHFSLQGSYKWLHLLDPLLKKYNNSIHRTIGMKPVSVTKKHEKLILKRLQKPKVVRGKVHLKNGDFVRVSKQKSLFEKGYTPNWSTEVFKIVKVQATHPVTYLLKDLNGTIIKGGFYSEELLKTKNKDVYLVEKVLRRRKDKAYVKWLGFDSSHNSWINEKDIVNN